MGVIMTLFFGACIGTLLTYTILFLEIIKKENNKTQDINNEIQSKIDNMTPRELYIHKLSQNNLVWDRATHTYTKMEQK
jgi:hypothetical protein|tara:strand:- start:2346 stop:2582 length:237 start_codon:yes stop_codon:yes gene_type:complete